MTKKEMNKIAAWNGYQLTIQKVRNPANGAKIEAVHILWEGEFFSQFVDWFYELELLSMKALLGRFEKVKHLVEEKKKEEAMLSPSGLLSS